MLSITWVGNLRPAKEFYPARDLIDPSASFIFGDTHYVRDCRKLLAMQPIPALKPPQNLVKTFKILFVSINKSAENCIVKFGEDLFLFGLQQYNSDKNCPKFELDLVS